MISIHNNHLCIITAVITMLARNDISKEKMIHKLIIVYLKGMIDIITVHCSFC